jgi:hypothetical protein
MEATPSGPNPLTQLRERLRGALGDAFQLERELKPGSMSLLVLAFTKR